MKYFYYKQFISVFYLAISTNGLGESSIYRPMRMFDCDSCTLSIIHLAGLLTLSLDAGGR